MSSTVARRAVAVLAVTLLVGMFSAVIGAGAANAADPTPSGTWTPFDYTSLDKAQFTNGGKDTTLIGGTTSGGCTTPGTADDPVDGFEVTVLGPGAFASAPDVGRADGLAVVGATDVGFSTTGPNTFVFREPFKDLAGELKTTIVPGDYVVTFRCVNQFDQITFQTYTATFTFSSATAFTVTSPAPVGPTPAPGATPTPVPAATPTPVPGATATPTPAATTTDDPTTTDTSSATDTTTATDTSDTSDTDTSDTDTDTSDTDTTDTSDTDTSTTDTTSDDADSTDGINSDDLSAVNDVLDKEGSVLAAASALKASDSSTDDSKKLAYTGTPLDTIVPLGVAFVAAGLLLLRAGRRRGLRG